MDHDELPTVSDRPGKAPPARRAPNMPSTAQVFGIIFMLISSISAGFLGGWLGASSRDRNSLLGSDTTQQQIVTSESQLINKLAKEVGPSVVSVNVTSQGQRNTLFGLQDTVQRSAGTGFILNAEGVIITNRHVVPRGTTSVSVTLSDGTILDNVTVIGRTNANDNLDVAFLKVQDKKGKDLKPVKLGDSSKAEVGDKVIAIGNALGQFQNTVTAGIISGFGRSVEALDSGGIETLQNLIQTDTAINQGNSGGPLVNMSGEVIGINTAVAGDAENIGFAIPINDVSGLIKAVLEKGKLERPYLGVRYITLTDDLAVEYDLNVKRGAYLAPASLSGGSPIVPNSPAAKAGLQEGDVITKVNDTDINEEHSLTSVIGRHGVGETVTLTVVRGGQTMSVKATLEAAPGD